MFTFIWLAITTVLGALLGHVTNDAPWVGALLGFFVGLMIRIGAEIGDIDG